MKTKTANAILPGAWIVVNNRKNGPPDRGRKSIKNGKVFLNDGQEFEIELFNPLTESVLADIRVNGSSISSTGLVIRPGQRTYLDCYVDERKKLVFRTYHVDNDEESLNAIKNNGVVEVFFYREQSVIINNWRDIFRGNVIREYYPVYVDRYPWWNTFFTYGTCATTGGVSSATVGTGNVTYTGFTFNSGGAWSGSNSANCANMVNYCSSSLDGGVGSSLETGRVEMGESSSQSFDYINMEFEKNYLHHIIYQILPESRMPVSVDEVKNFCHSCGSKIKQKFKFCPSCGDQI